MKDRRDGQIFVWSFESNFAEKERNKYIFYSIGKTWKLRNSFHSFKRFRHFLQTTHQELLQTEF